MIIVFTVLFSGQLLPNPSAVILTFPEEQCVMFCSHVVKTACAGFGQRHYCRVTASCLVTMTTMTNIVTNTDVLNLRRNIPATGRCKGSQCRM